jgi:hypothetical protein
MTEKPPPSNRKFGLFFAAIFALLAISSWWRHSGALPVTLGLSALFLLTALVRPQFLAPFNRAWMALAALLHRVASPIVLGARFFLVFTPMALAMKLGKRDSMTRSFDSRLSSYWNQRVPPGPPPSSLRDQF